MVDISNRQRDALVESLSSGVAEPSIVITDPAIIDAHCKDYRDWYRGSAIALTRPKTVRDVSDIMRFANERGAVVVPQGGNTSLCGGAVPAGDGRPSLILSTQGLKTIRQVDRSGWSMIAESGCTIAAIQDAAKAVGRHFGMDFGSRGSATIGGALSTNAGGMSVVRYGNCRDLTLGLEVVLPDGSLWSGLRALRKDNSGFDLKHLFIGAEGSVGVITAASLKLHPEEKTSATALVALGSLDAANTFAEMAMDIAHGQISAIELLPKMGIRRSCELLLDCRPPINLSSAWFVLLRLAGQEDVSETLEKIVSRAIEQETCTDAVIAQSSSQEARLWEIRDSFSDLHRHLGSSLRFDFAVPLGRVPDLYRRLNEAIAHIEPDFVPFGFGHLGDGNLHFSACQPARPEAGSNFLAKKSAIEDAANNVVWALGGTVSAEHGIGQLHRNELSHQKSESELLLMHKIKIAIDPTGMMNPDKFLPAMP